MNVLITGGAGFIGSNLIRYLLANGHRILNVDKLTYAGNLNSLFDVQQCDRYHFERMDINDVEGVSAILQAFRPNAIMNLAAESHVDRSIDAPGIFVETNVTGTFNLLNTALGYWRSLSGDAAKTFRFVQVSTDEVFGSLGTTGSFSEESPYAPRSPYAATKASADHLTRAWHETYGLPTIISRSTNNYGPYQFPEKLVPLMIIKCLRTEPLPVYGTGENTRDWLYVDDHCNALSLVAEHGIPGETYNIGAKNERTNLELVGILCEILDELRPSLDGKTHASRIRFVDDRPGHDHRYAIDSSKIEHQLHWRPKQTFLTSLKSTVKWYLENENWWNAILSDVYRLQRQGLPQIVKPQ